METVIEHGHSSKHGLIIDHPRRSKWSTVNMFGLRATVKENGNLRFNANHQNNELLYQSHCERLVIIETLNRGLPNSSIFIFF